MKVFNCSSLTLKGVVFNWDTTDTVLQEAEGGGGEEGEKPSEGEEEAAAEPLELPPASDGDLPTATGDLPPPVDESAPETPTAQGQLMFPSLALLSL